MSVFTRSGTEPRAIGIFGFTYAVFTHSKGDACAGLRNLALCSTDLADAQSRTTGCEFGYLVNLKTCRVQTYLDGIPADFCLIGDTAYGRPGMGHTELSNRFWLFSSVPTKEFDGLRDLHSTHDSLAEAESYCLSSKSSLPLLRLHDTLSGAVYTRTQTGL